MDTYDADTTGDFDENTLDGSEGLDGDVLYSDGENYVVDAPDRWRGAEPHDSLDERLREEKPDFGAEDDDATFTEDDRDYDDIDGPGQVEQHYDERLSMLNPEQGRTLGRE